MHRSASRWRPVVGAAAGLLPADLGERLMLGDTGANLLGAVLGLAVVLETSRPVRTVVLIVLIVLNLASERVSFSAVIDRTPGLRQLDRLGRRPLDARSAPRAPEACRVRGSFGPVRRCGVRSVRGVGSRRWRSDVAVGVRRRRRPVVLVAGGGEALGEVVEGAPALGAADDDGADVVAAAATAATDADGEVAGLDPQDRRVDEVGRRAAARRATRGRGRR